MTNRIRDRNGRSNPTFRGQDGSALVLVMVILTFVSIIAGIVLKGLAAHRGALVHSIHERQAMYLAEAGVYKALWCLGGNEEKDMTWRPNRTPVEVMDGHSAVVSVLEWGGFLSVRSEIEYKGSSKMVRALVGERPSGEFDYAVSLGSSGYPLVVTGHNRIVGDVRVGPKGVEAGWIKGKGFTGPKLVEGSVVRDDSLSIPEFNDNFFEAAMQDYRSFLIGLEEDHVDYTNGVVGEWLLDRYRGKAVLIVGNLVFDDLGRLDAWEGTLRLGCTGNITLQGKTRMRGRIQLLACGDIVIRNHTWLEGIILYSEEGIRCEDDVRIEGQLMSPGDIVLSDRCTLAYPSVVYCPGRIDEETILGSIELEDESVVKGTVILSTSVHDNVSFQNKASVRLAEGSTLMGVLYADQATELQGTAFGTVTTQRFRMVDPPTTYINWLRNTVIDVSVRPEGFLMPLSFRRSACLEVIEWEEVGS